MTEPAPDRLPRHQYYMNIAMAVRERANCLGSRVGALILLENRIVSTGYNGTPEGMTNCLDGGCERCKNRATYPTGSAYDLCICVHAEQNALLSAARFGIAVQGGSIYTTMQPCFGCFKELLQAKIENVYFLHAWKPSAHSAAQYLKIQQMFKGEITQIEMEDPKADWAISSRRREIEEVLDETGHQAG